MMTISTKGQIDLLKKERALIALYLDPAYADDEMNVVFAARRGFDRHVGKAWHLLIPVRLGGFVMDMPLEPSMYGVELAYSLIEDYDLAFTELPAFVFVPNVERDDFFIANLHELPKATVLKMMGVIASMAIEEYKDGPQDPNEFRDKINDRVEQYLRQQRVLRRIAKLGKHAGTLLGFAGLAV